MSFWENVQRGLEIANSAIEGYERGQQIANLASGDQGIVGTLVTTGDIDLYKVYLPHHGDYLFQMTQPMLTDFDLFILNSQGTVIASDQSDNNPSAVRVTGSGHCFAAVKSARGTGRYSLIYRRY